MIRKRYVHEYSEPLQMASFSIRHYSLVVRWYLRYALSYRDPEEILLERGLHVDHTTIYRWVQQYTPSLERRCRPYVKPTTDSWRVDETYIKVKKQWVYLYRAVDSAGNTLDFVLSPTRDTHAATQFFLKTLAASHTTEPRVIGRWTKTQPTPKRSITYKQKDTFPQAVNYVRSNTSTISSNRTIGSSNA